MNIGSVVSATVAQSVDQTQSSIATKVMKEQMRSEQELVGELLGSGQQISSQVYNGHGQVVPTPAGANVDMSA